MSESPEPQETETAPASTTSPTATKKSAANKKLRAPKKIRGKMKLTFLLDHEHALRIASVILERAGEEIYTIEQLHDLAMTRFMDYMQIKMGIDLTSIFPKKP